MQPTQMHDQSSRDESVSKANAERANTSRAMKMLEEGIAAITDSESFKNYLSLARSLHGYSARNLVLIHMQAPHASMIAGYKRWKALGRQVLKGSRAIKILAPVTRQVTDEDTGEQVRRVVGFRDANVFDVSSTVAMDGASTVAMDGADGPALPTVGELTGDEDGARSLYELLAGICADEGLPIIEKDLEDGDYGSYDKEAKYIVLSLRISELDRASTLCHELVHHLLHPLRDGDEHSHATRETEAEGAAFAICDAYGIDTSRFSFPYIVSHAGNPEVLTAALDRIQKVVHRVLDEAEKSRHSAADGEARAA